MKGVGLGVLAVLLLAACGSSSTTRTGTTAPAGGPTVAIASPADGATIRGNVVKLGVTAEGLTIVKPDGDTSGRTGHYHVFIDRDPVAPGAVVPKAAGIVHSAVSPVLLTGLSVGSHRLTVVLGDGAHHRIGASQASITVSVAGPSLHATAPRQIAAGQDLTIAITVEGVRLVKPADDTGAPGTTGHLHIFIDPATPPTANGQPIPKVEGSIIHTADTSYTVHGLAAGKHTIWVVLGDRAHVPYDPLVADRFVVVVV